MERHHRLLGILYIISGILQILFVTVASFVIALILNYAFVEGGAASFKYEYLMEIIGYIRIFVLGVVIVLSVPSIIAGIGLLNYKSWALTFALILGCLKLFSFPFGTALGIYTLWVYFQDKTISKPTTQS